MAGCTPGPRCRCVARQLAASHAAVSRGMGLAQPTRTLPEVRGEARGRLCELRHRQRPHPQILQEMRGCPIVPRVTTPCKGPLWEDRPMTLDDSVLRPIEPRLYASRGVLVLIVLLTSDLSAHASGPTGRR